MRNWAIGLMSGTSADGIDAALVEIHSVRPSLSLTVKRTFFAPYSESQRSRIFEAFSPEFGVRELGRLNRDLGLWFADAVNQLLEDAQVDKHDVRVIGSHGQTVAHYPPESDRLDLGYCVQLGEPAVIAQMTGIDVVSDFRAADLAVGGQGAPLIPFFDAALFRTPSEHRVVLNIGGIANITVLPRAGQRAPVVGFDTGPGNMVLDGLVSLISGGAQRCDVDGALAQAGAVHDRLLRRWLSHEYFAKTPPKSTGRELFGVPYCTQLLNEATREGLGAADMIRTATALVAESIAQAIRQQLGDAPIAPIASGGGPRNPVLMHEIQQRTRLVRDWQPVDDYGIPSDFKEAVAFALFGWEFCDGVPTNVCAATGAGRSVMQGSWTPARTGTVLPWANPEQQSDDGLGIG